MEVDAFLLNNEKSSEKKYFLDGIAQHAPQRRYHTFNYALFCFLVNSMENLSKQQTIECPDGEDFQLAFLRSSISTLANKIVKQLTAVKQPLFNISMFRRWHLNGVPCIVAMQAILDQSAARKGDFHALKTDLHDLDVDNDTIVDAVSLALHISKNK